MRLFRRLRNLWWATQRKTDLQILWPICKEKSFDIQQAKAAFAIHAFNDPCWINFYGKEGLVKVIDRME